MSALNHPKRIMIVANGSCQYAANVALSLSQRTDIFFNPNF